MQPDDPDTITAEIRRAALAADIVLIIAGSSAGRSDHTAAVVARAGALTVNGVAVRAGHPVLLGYAQPNRGRADQSATTIPVIGIPGYPLAAAVIFELFAAPLFAALQGSPQIAGGSVRTWRATGPPRPMSKTGSRCPLPQPRRAGTPVAPPWPHQAGAAPGQSAD